MHPRLRAPLLALALLTPVLARAAEEDVLILWNQHNGIAKDRGTKVCKVEVFHGGTPLWEMARVEIPWDANADTKVVLPIPQQISAIDRVRVTLLEIVGNGGGLAEIEFYEGKTNLARTAKASASGFFHNEQRFAPVHAIDGITSSANMFVGYWLPPDAKPGRKDWIELALQRPELPSGFFGRPTK